MLPTLVFLPLVYRHDALGQFEFDGHLVREQVHEYRVGLPLSLDARRLNYMRSPRSPARRQDDINRHHRSARKLSEAAKAHTVLRALPLV